MTPNQTTLTEALKSAEIASYEMQLRQIYRVPITERHPNDVLKSITLNNRLKTLNQ
jgi:hypothetical protein